MSIEHFSGEPNIIPIEKEAWNKFNVLARMNGPKVSEKLGAGPGDTIVVRNLALEPQMPEHTEASKNLNNEKKNIRVQIDVLMRRQEILTEQTKAITQIPILFDVPIFFDIEQHLSLLNSAGVSNILVGGQIYSISNLHEMVAKVSAYSSTIHATREDGRKTNEDILKDLAEMGITRSKISEFSALGFRESMLACIRGDRRAVIFK